MNGVPGTLWTIGHSTRPLEVFVSMLLEEGIATVVDVRRFAGSRRNPQFASGALAGSLRAAGIEYVAMPELGGHRVPRPDSRNLAWRSAGFRGYADYMETDAFTGACDRVSERARIGRTAVMCAEALWWQCHRSLISDFYKARGWEVLHLVAPGRVEAHPYTAEARVVDGRLEYPAPEAAQGSLF